MKTSCALGILCAAVMLSGCASGEHGMALAPVCPSATQAMVHRECGGQWEEAKADSEADIVRLPDGRIVGLLPPERSP